MSVMSGIATELEIHWRQASVGCYWSRPLPSGQTAVIGTWQTGLPWGDNFRSGYSLTVDRKEVWSGEELAEAIVAAGAIAGQQLKAQMAEWTVI